ncbi:hypothetical protein Sbs19_37110 [Sphingobium sp. BS19]|nr:hypothetical protein Sbs19_37110 [Sphingobium sp. BS19]
MAKPADRPALANWIGASVMPHEPKVICPLLSGPESLLFWIMKEFGNGQEAQAGRDYRQAA